MKPFKKLSAYNNVPCEYLSSTSNANGYLTKEQQDAMERMFESMSETLIPESDVAALKAENAKLRELVQEAYAFSEALCEVVENSPGCFMCPANQDEDNPCGSAVIYDRMRELGVKAKAQV